jgi:hypothetical protein
MTRNLQTIQRQAEELAKARHIASLFDIPESFDVMDFAGKGNINQQTFLIAAGPAGNRAEYLLQKINPNVFVKPRLVMHSMISCIEAQRIALHQGVLRPDEEWETIQLIRTKKGDDYLEISEKERIDCWRMMIRMRDTSAYKSLWDIRDPKKRLRVAEETGKGLALFGNLAAVMPIAGLNVSLPGYRDTRLYYDQLQSTARGNRSLAQAADLLPTDPLVRQCTEQHFLVHLNDDEYRRRMSDPQIKRLVTIAFEQKSFALTLLQGLMSGRLIISVIHGDTKLENFLFSKQTGKAKSLIDLDTIMPHTWLSDWGDMVRSLVNAAGEKEPDIQKIDVDMEVFRAVARGFLGAARSIRLEESGLMMEAAQIMSLELGVRFLADYIRGDVYFRLNPTDPRDLNKIRALVQFAVFEKLRAKADNAKQYIQKLIHQRSAIS